MAFPLETAAHPENLRRVVIEPVSRVEGHGKVTILLDADDKVHQVRLHIVEFRGFEKFIQGRPYWEVPVMVQRLCGICPVSHHLAASKALDIIVGAKQLTPTAEKMRRLMHLGQILQSHALHFFHLASPDLLFGFDAEVAKRNIVGVAAVAPEVARKGVLLRKYGQEIIRHTAGKRVHGTGSVPGGVNKNLTRAERAGLLGEIDTIVEWSREAVGIIRKLFADNAALYASFGRFDSNRLSLVRADGALDLYHGGLRATDGKGGTIFDHADYQNYYEYLHEEVKPWSYMKFPFIVEQGTEAGWYRVGPLARVAQCDFIPGHDLVATGERQERGVGVIEAPRGTLIHHYRVNEDDQIVNANLIVSTTHNNQAMNEAVRQVAMQYLDGRTLTEGLLNHIEVAIRAFDPCLSCATHALGKMPLEAELVDADGSVIGRLARNGG